MGKVIEKLNGAIDEFLKIKSKTVAHFRDEENPHSVTAEQVGLGNVDNVKQATRTEFYYHTGNKNNPHSVTAAQVGLGNVENVKQASRADYEAHIKGTADRHTADGIIYEGGKTLKEQIVNMQVAAGQGTILHNELQNRDTANQHSIDSITDLRDTLGYTIVMTGETTDGTTYVELLGDPSLPQSKTGGFLNSDGRLTVPRGIIARAEINIMCAQYAADTDGVNKINGNNTVRFYLDTYALAINSMRQIWYKDASGKKMEFTKFARSTDTAATIDAKLATNDVESNELSVRGAADTPMKWRAEIKISSILKV